MSGRHEHLFTYGTLQDARVQENVFGRTMAGRPAVLSGFRWHANKVYGAYPAVEPTDNPTEEVSGQVLDITATELRQADAYEGGGYRRIRTQTLSGERVWVYIEKTD